jgi:hypothetical protein
VDSNKTKTYITLFIGFVVAFFVFCLDQRGGFERVDPYYSFLVEEVLNDIFGIDRDIGEVIWWILLIAFIYSWWKLRNCISNVLMKIHKKV